MSSPRKPRITKHKDGWNTNTAGTVKWKTARWHNDHPEAYIMQMLGERGYWIYPSAHHMGVIWGVRVGPYKTLDAAKARVLLGDIEYYPVLPDPLTN